MQNPFSDLIPGGTSQLPALRQVIPPQRKQPPPQTTAQRRKDELDVQNAQLNAQNTREQMQERRGKAAAEQNKFRDQVDTATSDIMRVVDRLDRVAKDADDNSGWFETGALGTISSAIPGSASKSLRRDLDLVGSNAAIESLMQMRRESPTGAGVGNVALGEMQLMKDKYGVFDPNQPHDDFMQNIAEGKREFLLKLKRINPRAFKEYMGKNPDGVWPLQGGGYRVGPLRLNEKPQRQRQQQQGLPQGWSIEEE